MDEIEKGIQILRNDFLNNKKLLIVGHGPLFTPLNLEEKSTIKTNGNFYRINTKKKLEKIE